ncbi:hypothetical protein, partial [Pseudomonas syringae]|uniref:hypothetical protein n=1 Tax=Pseudomonas syringae TaxID=317 RepID=UPI001C557814
LGVGEGHLFHHRKARRLVSGDFAKLGSLFQSFLRVRDYLIKPIWILHGHHKSPANPIANVYCDAIANDGQHSALLRFRGGEFCTVNVF